MRQSIFETKMRFVSCNRQIMLHTYFVFSWQISLSAYMNWKFVNTAAESFKSRDIDMTRVKVMSFSVFSAFPVHHTTTMHHEHLLSASSRDKSQALHNGSYSATVSVS